MMAQITSHWISSLGCVYLHAGGAWRNAKNKLKAAATLTDVPSKAAITQPQRELDPMLSRVQDMQKRRQALCADMHARDDSDHHDESIT